MTISITRTPQAGIVQHGAERRKAERTSLNIQAILRFQNRLFTLQGSLCDLSVGGTGFLCHQTATAHARCTLQFLLPGAPGFPSHSVSLPVVVIDHRQVTGQAHLFRIHLQFAGLPANVRQHIEELVRQALLRH